jgi:hypothetical protein
MTEASDGEFLAAYAIVGEIVLSATALDHQMNHVLIEVASLAKSPLLEAVIATLDPARKIEILKARARRRRKARPIAGGAQCPPVTLGWARAAVFSPALASPPPALTWYPRAMGEGQCDDQGDAGPRAAARPDLFAMAGPADLASAVSGRARCWSRFLPNIGRARTVAWPGLCGEPHSCWACPRIPLRGR